MRGAAALVVLCGCRGILGIHGLADSPDAAAPPGDTGSTDASGDSATGPDVPAGLCPAGFIQLPGGSAHFYQVDNGPDLYASQRNDCEASAPIAYLAIPDDQTELTGLATLTSQFWIGIDDLVTEGTYVTAKGNQATFLPFAPNEPTGNQQQNCLFVDGNAQFHDQQCTANLPAICECEPSG